MRSRDEHATCNRSDCCISSRRQLVEEFAQFGRGLELRDWIQLLEGAGERVGQAPHRA
jgi:hypothetical protein